MSYDNYKKGVEIAKELSRYFIKGGEVSKERIEEKNKNAIKVLMEYEGGEAYEMTIGISILGKIKKLVCIDDFYNKQKNKNFIWTK